MPAQIIHKILKPYRLSFTGANAMLSEFVRVARHVADGMDADSLDVNILGRDKSATNIRELRELKHRLNTLTTDQTDILAHGNPDEQKQITHLALAKTYRIYRDFAEEVLAEKILVFDDTLTDLDYNMFISRKKLDHPELDEITLSTQKKIKQVMMRMLVQTGMIESMENPIIHVPVLTARVEQAVVAEDRRLLACFLYDENRIQSL